ncbi:MAG: hypothetical protein ABIF12_00250 [bacterium]
MVIKISLINALKKFKINGTAFQTAFDANIGFIYDNINPDIKICFKNKENKYLTKNYKSSISSIGIKLDAAFYIDLIFFIDTDINFFDSKDTIELGSGVSFNIGAFSGLSFTYSSIKNAPGGILIIGIPFGLFTPGISYVMGGKLTAKD